QRHDLDLAPTPAPLGIDVQDAHGYGSLSRISTASAVHIAIATSLSPKLYWVMPPTRKPTMPAQAPAAVARTVASGASAIAVHPRRSATAKRSANAARPVSPASVAIRRESLCACERRAASGGVA